MLLTSFSIFKIHGNHLELFYTSDDVRLGIYGSGMRSSSRTSGTAADFTSSCFGGGSFFYGFPLYGKEVIAGYLSNGWQSSAGAGSDKILAMMFHPGLGIYVVQNPIDATTEFSSNVYNQLFGGANPAALTASNALMRKALLRTNFVAPKGESSQSFLRANPTRGNFSDYDSLSVDFGYPLFEPLIENDLTAPQYALWKYLYEFFAMSVSPYDRQTTLQSALFAQQSLFDVAGDYTINNSFSAAKTDFRGFNIEEFILGQDHLVYTRNVITFTTLTTPLTVGKLYRLNLDGSVTLLPDVPDAPTAFIAGFALAVDKIFILR
jgi:hypothetical protein